MAFDVFISHSNKDKQAADATCAALESGGIRCWIAPRDVRPGTDYAAEIVNAIETCRMMVVIVSTSSNDSRQVPREVEQAVRKGVPIIPMRIEDVDLNPAMGYFLDSIHWLDAITPPLAKHLELLIADIRRLLQGEPTPAKPTPVASSLPTGSPRISAPFRWTGPIVAGGVAAAIVLGGVAVLWPKLTATAPAVSGAALVTGSVVPASVADRFLAIAVSRTSSAWGGSDTKGLSSQEEAQNDALGNCGKHASDCHIAGWTLNSCLTLAIGANNSWGYGKANSSDDARDTAIAYCNKFAGTNCTVVYAACTTPR